MAYEYTTDVTITVSGSITFRDIPSFTYKTILALLEGHALGSVETALDAEPEPEAEPEPAAEPEPELPEIARTIKRLREIYRLSRRELGDAIGYTSESVKLWEKGASKPSRDARDLLETHFGLETLDGLTEADFAEIAKRREREIAEREKEAGA